MLLRQLKYILSFYEITSLTAFKASSLCWTGGYKSIRWNRDSKTGRREPTLPVKRTNSMAILKV